MSQLKKWLDEQRPLALRKSLLGKAIGNALNDWEAVKRNVEEGDLG